VRSAGSKGTTLGLQHLAKQQHQPTRPTEPQHGTKAPTPHLPVQLHPGGSPGDMEQRHHAAVHVIVQVAVEQPGAWVVGVHVEGHQGAGLDGHLVGGLRFWGAGVYGLGKGGRFG